MNTILAKKSRLPFYRSIPLYTETEPGKFVLYKPAGLTLSEMRLKRGLHPTLLYIEDVDKIKGIQDVQRGFHQELRRKIAAGKTREIKSILVEILEDTFSAPRTGSLEGVGETIEIIIENFQNQGNEVVGLARVPFKEYTVAIHSTNVMAFTLGYCFRHSLPLEQARALGLAALLHDVGKATMPEEILYAPRKLTDEEFEIMKSHPQRGYQILQGCNFADQEVRQGAWEHHEKTDGSGYPMGKEEISFVGQLLGIIDCFEAITADSRPYRDAAEPIDALTLLKDEVMANKYDLKLFEKFAYSLT